MPTMLETRLQGYDTIVALTQNTINSNLSNIMGVQDGIDMEWNLEIPDFDCKIESIMAAPTVVIGVKNRPRAVRFELHLISGTFSYGSKNQPDPVEIPIDHWDIGFIVDLKTAQADLAQLKLPDSIVNEIRNKGEGMFSIRQLFLDFENADLAEFDRKLPQGLNAIAKAKLMDTVTVFLDNARTNGYHILGSAISVINPNATHPENPSFPPTDFQFITNLYLPDGVEPGDLDTPPRDHGLDTLQFAIMTRNRPFPSAPGWFGNWAGDRDTYGVMAISRETFLDSFLLPKLGESAALHSSLSVDGSDVRLDTNSGGTITPTATGGIHQFSTSIDYKTDLEFNHHFWTISHKTTVTVPKRDHRILITIESNLEHLIKHGIGSDDRATVEKRMDYTITLDSTHDGALNVTVKATPFLDTVDGTLIRQSEHLSDVLSKIIDTNEIADLIRGGLGTTRGFVFPGGNQFDIANPMFNDELDLLATLTMLL